MYTGANSQTILERISWACANLVLPPSSAFPLLRSPNVFSRARGTPKAQTQRMSYLSFPLALVPLVLTLFSQIKVCRAPTTIPATTAVCPTYRGEREKPGRLASWLLRAPIREYRNRHTPRRSTKSCAGEAGPARTGDPPEQCGHRSGSRFKEESQAKRRGISRSSSNNHSAGANHRRCYNRNCWDNSARGYGGSHSGSSCRRSPTNNTRVKQLQPTESARGIDVDAFIDHEYGPSCDAR